MGSLRRVKAAESTTINGERSTAPQIYVDARALQDPDYRYRGVGQHSSALLSSMRLRTWPRKRPNLIALTSPNLPTLPLEHAALFDEIKTTTILNAKPSSIFLCLSPMTHDPLRFSRSLMDPSILKVSLFYDLIQLQFPERYLSAGPVRADFGIRLAWLSSFDLIASISSASGKDAVEVAGIASDRVFVTGVAVRQSLEPVKNEECIPWADRGYYILAGGGDPRKNPGCVVTAHGRHARANSSETALHVIGSYPESMRAELRARYAAEGGHPKKLKFFDHIDDSELRFQYRYAIAAIVSSVAEGFSVPIIEASAADTPALVSRIPAHLELIKNDLATFSPLDPVELQDIFRRLESPEDSLWAELSASHRDVWQRFTIERVGERFLDRIDDFFSAPASPMVKRQARLKLGILTPVSPAASGVADFSSSMIKAVAKIADVDVFTDTEHPRTLDGIRSLAGLPQARSQMSSLDSVVSVIGNSHFHRGEFAFLLDHGGAAIVHDARMINFYVILLGMGRTLKVARSEFVGGVDEALISHWLHHQENLPVLFLSEILEAASPTFVHSPTTAKMISDLYEKKPVILPFAQYIEMIPDQQTAERRLQIRETFEIAANDFLVVTFGFVAPDKAPDELIWSVKMLRDWGVPAKLVFCGGFVTSELGVRLKQLVSQLDMDDHVRFCDDVVSSETYQSLLFAAEAAIQLRTYFMGGLSGALNDCIAAALPCVANEHLAEAMEAPRFVRRVPDSLSPLLVAEALLDIIATGEDRIRPIEEARLFADEHSFTTYAARLVEQLGGPEADLRP